jgi:hypothetical protein
MKQQEGMSIRRLLLAALCAPLIVSALWAPAALASTPEGSGPENAQLDGRSIDLSKGWENAQSCVDLPTEVRCFATHAEADAFLGYSPETDPAAQGRSAAAVPDCAGGWLCLYDGLNGQGRRLIFRDEFWQNLGGWGFARQTESVRNNQACNDFGGLDEVPPGIGILIDPCAIYNDLGAWRNRATGVLG